MSDVICVTNRKLCPGSFMEKLKEILEAAPAAVILREKDLPEEEYEKLAAEALKLAGETQTLCILHTFRNVAEKLHSKAIHLPMPILRTLTEEEKACFSILGASCHSVEEAQEAEKLGCTYITAGHVFATDCKKGLPPRGTAFLSNVCKAVSIPVYAIGGIGPENFQMVKEAGAAGGCIMSSIMQCGQADRYLKEFEDEIS